MTIRLKLLLFTVLAVLASLLPSLMGLSALHQTQEKLQFINERIVPRLNLCANIRSTFKDLRIDNIYLIYESDATFQSNTRARRLDTISKLNGYLDSYKADAVDDADKARQQNFVSLLGKYNALYDVVLAARSQPAELHRAIEPWRAVGVALGNSVSDMVEAAGRQARQTQQQAEHDFAWAQKVFAGSLLLSMLLLCGFGWLIQRGINRPVRAAVTAVRGIADNQDLSQSVVVSSNDEIGGLLQAFNLLLGKMRLSIQQIGGNAASVTEAAEDLSVASDQVRSGAHMASVSAAEMAAAIEQVTVSISHIAERTRDADQLAAQTGSQVGLGEELIHETVTEIESISSAVHETARYINELQNRTESIGSVVGVISDIADQINLLALNAAIEAARAGESGRGFAVVADEVRKLAERTSASTSTITSTVSSIRDGSSETVELIDNVVNRVEQGVAKVRATGDAIGQLRVLAKQVERQVSDIAAAIQEQSNASGLIAGKVENIAQIAEESSVAADSTAQNAQRLHLLAQDMRRDVACYRT